MFLNKKLNTIALALACISAFSSQAAYGMEEELSDEGYKNHIGMLKQKCDMLVVGKFNYFNGLPSRWARSIIKEDACRQLEKEAQTNKFKKLFNVVEIEEK